jgi:hypothetical protein
VPPIFRGIAPRQAKGQGNSDDGFSDIGGGRGHRPIYCDFITRLDLDFFNDNVPVPAAFDINAGAIHPDRLAAFQLFALTDDPRFYANVTTERKSIKVRVHGLKGRFYYSESSGIPRIFFRPDSDQAGKTGTITFYYQCRRPPEVFRTRFVLTVLRSPAPIDESAGVAGVRLDVDSPAARGGSPLEPIAVEP